MDLIKGVSIKWISWGVILKIIVWITMHYKIEDNLNWCSYEEVQLLNKCTRFDVFNGLRLKLSARIKRSLKFSSCSKRVRLGREIVDLIKALNGYRGK